jgi:hypothetical protein
MRPPRAADFPAGMRSSVLEMTAHRFGGDADRCDRIEQLAMRDAKMLAPPLYLPAFGEIDRELGALRGWPCVAAPLDGSTRQFHDGVPARPNSPRERESGCLRGLVPAATPHGWIVSGLLRTVIP